MPSPILRRIFRRERRDVHDTLVLLFLHGGMGDRVIFEGLVRHWIGVAGAERRIVVAIPPHGDQYDARRYPTAPDQLWIVEAPRPETVIAVAEGVHLAARDGFGFAGEVGTLCFGPQLSAPIDVPGLRWQEPYEVLGALARARRVYPRFPCSDAARAAGRAWREAFAPAASGAPAIVVHCRTRADLAERNPSADDMVAAAAALQRTLGARVVACGAGDVPPALEALAAARLVDPDPMLDATAGRLAACDLFFGGESGPMHLAAAVDVPVVLVARPGRGEGRWGPFLPPGRWREVPGVEREPGGPLRLDPAAVVDAAAALLGRGQHARTRAG
jgi:hypothetical protein